MADNPTSDAAGLMQVMGGPYGVVANYKAGWSLYLSSVRATGYGWYPWHYDGYPTCGIR